MSADPFKKYSGKVLIDGEFRDSVSTDRINVIDPATEEVIGEIADASDDEVDASIDAAHKAQAGWAKMSGLERAAALHAIADALLENSAALAETMTREMGKPFKESMDEVEWSTTAFRHYAEYSRHDCGRINGPVVGGHLNMVTKHPLGVVGIILPFNYPSCLFAWQASAALGAGNGIVLKPSEHTTHFSLMMLDVIISKLPRGLIGAISGGVRVGSRLVGHDKIGGVAFTGSVPAGISVAQTCAKTFKKALIETSGNDPFIVMPSAPIDVAAKAAVFASNLNAGQVCAASERFYIHEKVYDEFAEKVIEGTKKIRVGNGLDKVDMGPMVSDRERTRYEGLLKRAVDSGIEVATGGGRPAQLNRGYFVEPTVLLDVPTDAEIVNTETFGPVTPICRISSLDEAIHLANNSRFGLGSTIYTKDLKEAMRAIDELEAGMTWVNAPLFDNDAAPFGGRKFSGSGSQLGSEGLDQFRHSKMVMIDPDCGEHHWWYPYADDKMFPGKTAG